MDRGFWRDVFAWSESVTPRVLARVLIFTGYAFFVGWAHAVFSWQALETAPVQYTGAALALLLVLRTNVGYERWWEGRRLWGGIVNQTRNLATVALALGPADPRWQERFVRLTIAFAHVCRTTLRGERAVPELTHLLSPADAQAILEASHRPTRVSRALAGLLGEAVDDGGMNPMALLAADRERALLLDHLGGCERILRTPMPLVHAIKLRRFIVLYLAVLPFAVGGGPAFVALVAALVAYPLLAIDQIGSELQRPFDPTRLSHLPLDAICRNLEDELFDLLARTSAPPPRPDVPTAHHQEL